MNWMAYLLDYLHNCLPVRTFSTQTLHLTRIFHEAWHRCIAKAKRVSCTLWWALCRTLPPGAWWAECGHQWDSDHLFWLPDYISWWPTAPHLQLASTRPCLLFVLSFVDYLTPCVCFSLLQSWAWRIVTHKWQRKCNISIYCPYDLGFC